ncbi:MAG: hypothetical protein QOC83_4874, partial [Pseudonocardiales bacterium]|nr:hypothetical protein [Pseudonocardiales bacterium]
GAQWSLTDYLQHMLSARSARWTPASPCWSTGRTSRTHRRTPTPRWPRTGPVPPTVDTVLVGGQVVKRAGRLAADLDRARSLAAATAGRLSGQLAAAR